jgi:hypothetical protein
VGFRIIRDIDIDIDVVLNEHAKTILLIFLLMVNKNQVFRWEQFVDALRKEINIILDEPITTEDDSSIL